MCVVIICGGRFNHLTAQDRIYLDKLLVEIPISFVITGGASGIDTDAKNWAIEKGLEHIEEFADWSNISYHDSVVKINKKGQKYDMMAGYRRNIKMAEMADVCIALKGGNGTKHMIKISKEKGLNVYSNYFDV